MMSYHSLLRSSRVALACLTLMAATSLALTSVALAQSPGQAELDQATDLKLDADNIEKLGQVIDLCKKALEKGLNEGDTELAKQLISS